jgi:hypothetical protein
LVLVKTHFDTRQFKSPTEGFYDRRMQPLELAYVHRFGLAARLGVKDLHDAFLVRCLDRGDFGSKVNVRGIDEDEWLTLKAWCLVEKLGNVWRCLLIATGTVETPVFAEPLFRSYRSPTTRNYR